MNIGKNVLWLIWYFCCLNGFRFQYDGATIDFTFCYCTQSKTQHKSLREQLHTMNDWSCCVVLFKSIVKALVSSLCCLKSRWDIDYCSIFLELCAECVWIVLRRELENITSKVSWILMESITVDFVFEETEEEAVTCVKNRSVSSVC